GAFQAELREFPENLDAWSRLAFLYASQGRVVDFRLLLSDMTARVPSNRAFETAVQLSETVGDTQSVRQWRHRKAQRSGKAG
ncbi:MAG: hypothetical protein ACREVW_16430, partial [Burkholderiales bacterium]